MADLKKTLTKIHEALAAELLSRIQSGEASAAELQAARQLLRDNNITSVPVAGQNALGDLHSNLPFGPADEKEDYIN